MTSEKPLKIMYLNPLASSASYDPIFADMAREHKLPQTEVHVASLPESEGGFTHIEFRAYEAMVTRGIIRAVRAAAREGFDALAIGCFYDTALHDAREVSGGMIVTAPCVASCEIAASLSNRFGIIVGRRKWVHQMHATVREHGHEHRLSGFYHVELGVNEFPEGSRRDRAAADRGRTQGGRGGFRRSADPRLHDGGRLLQGGRAAARRAGDRPVDRGPEARRIRRDPEAAMRLAAEPEMVERIA